MQNNSTLIADIERMILRAALPAAIVVVAASLTPLPAVCGDNLSSATESGRTYADPICNLMVKNLENEISAITDILENCQPEGPSTGELPPAFYNASARKSKCAKYSGKLELTEANLLRVKEQCDNGLTPSFLPKVVDNPNAAVPCRNCGAAKRRPKVSLAGKVLNLKAGNSSPGARGYNGIPPLDSKTAPAPAAAPYAVQPARASRGAGSLSRAGSVSVATVIKRQPGDQNVSAVKALPTTLPRSVTAATSADANLIPRPVVYWAGGTSNFFDFFGIGIGPGAIINLIGVTAQKTFVPIDPAIWDFVNINYPAACFPMAGSVQQGKAMVIKAIKSRPGPFALAGTSQGSWVMDEVYNEIRYGSLQSRRKDLLAGCQFGDPMREEGVMFPGCPDPGLWNVPGSRSGGHGLLPVSKRLKGTESLWWEFANVGDPVATTGDDAFGVRIQSFADFVLLGGGNLKSVLGLGELVDVFKRILLPNSPHNGYSSLPAYPGAKETSSQIAVKYLNAVGQNYYNNAKKAAQKK